MATDLDAWRAVAEKELQGAPVPLEALACDGPRPRPWNGNTTRYCQPLELDDPELDARLGDARAGQAGWLELSWPAEWTVARVLEKTAEWSGFGLVSEQPVAEFSSLGSAQTSPQLQEWVQRVPMGEPVPRTGRVWLSSVGYAEAGADAVQELGLGLAEWVRLFEQRSDPHHLGWVLAAGPQLWTEVAKLRAARLLWGKLMAAYGWIHPLELHVQQSSLYFTNGDRDTNLLRSATAAFAACVTGAVSLRLLDVPGHPARYCRNQLHLLREEGFLQRVCDPLAGAYSLERLTDRLARGAWRLMQQVLREGPGEILEVAYRQKREALAYDRSVLVGTTRYVPMDEKLLELSEDHRLASPYERLRRDAPEIHAQLIVQGTPMAKARAEFARNFLAIGGYRCDSAESRLRVVCCEDEEQAEQVRLAQGPGVVVVVAGKPVGEPIADLYIHRHSHRLESLQELRGKF